MKIFVSPRSFWCHYLNKKYVFEYSLSWWHWTDNYLKDEFEIMILSETNICKIVSNLTLKFQDNIIKNLSLLFFYGLVNFLFSTVEKFLRMETSLLCTIKWKYYRWNHFWNPIIHIWAEHCKKPFRQKEKGTVSTKIRFIWRNGRICMYMFPLIE